MSEDANDQLNADAENMVEQEKIEKALKDAENGQPRTVNVACRRNEHLDGRPGAASGDGDISGNAFRCTATTALVMNDVMENVQSGHTIYRCTECGYSWSVTTGGTFNY